VGRVGMGAGQELLIKGARKRGRVSG
jgi:hypothetical protein